MLADTDKTTRARASRASPPTHTQRRPCPPGVHPIKDSTDAAPKVSVSSKLPAGPLLLAKTRTSTPPPYSMFSTPLCLSRIMESPYRAALQMVLQRCCHLHS